MKERMVTLPELALVAGTRMAFGAGLGLLLADRIHPEQRRAAGWALLAVGALTTIPLAAEILLRDAGANHKHLAQTSDEPIERERNRIF